MKVIFTLVFVLTQLYGFSQEKVDKTIVAFVYHRFGDARYPSTNVSLEDFKAHLKYLKDNNFQVLTLSQAADYLKSNKPVQKTAVITIDDGYESFYKNGLPLLEKYGFPATLFINTETVGGSDYMNWTELKDVQDRNVEIGNHTHSHAYFLNQSVPDRYINFVNELRLSQQLIEQHLERKPTAFAYPYGEVDPKMEELVADTGFKMAAAQNSGVIYSGSDLMRCPRFPMSESYAAPDKFAAKAEMLPLKVLSEKPESFVLIEGTNRPQLTIQFDQNDLLIDQLQCFIQGSNCSKEIDVEKGKVTLTIQSSSNISNRRRTLYTITVPDKNGKWHWFSHLWINPEVD